MNLHIKPFNLSYRKCTTDYKLMLGSTVSTFALPFMHLRLLACNYDSGIYFRVTFGLKFITYDITC